MKLNKEWHKKHPMPKKPTEAERLEWHIEHAQNCTCRKMPEKLKNFKEAALYLCYYCRILNDERSISCC
jgi:hypothetical protein